MRPRSGPGLHIPRLAYTFRYSARQVLQNGLDVSDYHSMRTAYACSLSRRGNLIIAASSTTLVIGLSWGGVRYPWGSYQVLVPLVCGAVGMIAFTLYEAFIAKYPIVSALIIAADDATGAELLPCSSHRRYSPIAQVPLGTSTGVIRSI